MKLCHLSTKDTEGWERVMDTREAKRKEQVEERYNCEWQPYKSDFPRIKAVIGLVGKGKRVLDIGCYDGTIAKAIADKGNDVYGMDFSSVAVDLARRKGIKAFQGDGEGNSFPFEKHFFDVIVAGEIIEHVYDTDAFLERLKLL